MRSDRTKAVSISDEVKRVVYERDMHQCILCGKPGLPEAHYIPRSHDGLGIPENIVTLCRKCHGRLDQTVEREKLLGKVRAHLDLWYPGFSDDDRIYGKDD